MPRGAWIAPGIVPSRHTSRTSRMSTITVSGSPRCFIASVADQVSISALAVAQSSLMPRLIMTHPPSPRGLARPRDTCLVDDHLDVAQHRTAGQRDLVLDEPAAARTEKLT